MQSHSHETILHFCSYHKPFRTINLGKSSAKNPREREEKRDSEIAESCMYTRSAGHEGEMICDPLFMALLAMDAK